MIMAITGAALVLFVTFHCLLNAIAICWPTTYNSVCMFLGANWYALLASVVLAALIVIHIVYACALTMKNRKARGSQGYSISKRPATVEWSSKNMLVLGIVILAFLVVHLIQFWAKMQLQEIRGSEEMLPPAAGTLFIQEAFGQPWTAIVYIIGFIALWFHLQHGFWSMFQSVGWDSSVWIPRLKKIGCWWVSLVCLCFTAQAIVFTVKAHEGFYKTNPELRNQYMAMLPAMYERDFGPSALQLQLQFESQDYEQTAQMIQQNLMQLGQLPDDINDPNLQAQLNSMPMESRPQMVKQYENLIRIKKAFKAYEKFINYLEGRGEELPEAQIMPMGPQAAPQAAPQPETAEAPEAQQQPETQPQPQN